MILQVILLCICGATPLVNSFPDMAWYHGGLDVITVPLTYSVLEQNDNEALKISFMMHEKTISLNLEKHDHVVMGSNTPVFKATKNVGTYKEIHESIIYKQIPNAVEQLNMVAFMDKEKNALAVRSNGVEMFGLFIVNNVTFSFAVQKLAKAQPTISITGPSEMLSSNTIDLRTYDSANYASEPITAYPEMLVVIDSSFYEASGRSWEKLVKYMFSYWMAIDLRFRSIKNPQVRINIAGLVIATEDGAVPYKSNSISQTLNNIGQYFHPRPKVLPKPDVVSFIQYVPLVAGKYIQNISGVTYSRPRCNSNYRYMVSTDTSDYAGVNVAARELAYLIGANNHMFVVGYCGKDHKNDLMGSNIVPVGRIPAMEFSECSKNEIKTFLKSPEAKCYYNKPSVRK